MFTNKNALNPRNSLKPLSMVAISVAVLLAAPHAFAWGDIGHSAVGYIAEKNLSPKAKAMVYQIVGAEPLSVSAIFPDQVRSDDRFKQFSAFHFFEIPPGYSFATLPDEKRAERDAHTIVSQVPALLLKKDLSSQQKMILYRYLIHVVGDIHQPLHIGNGLDMGANLCDVNWVNPDTNLTQKVDLHKIWDEGLIQNIGAIYKHAHQRPGAKEAWFGYKELGDTILAETSTDEIAKINASPSNDYGTWYDEARALHAAVYPDAAPVAKPEDRAYCKIVNSSHKTVAGNYDEAKIPTLSEDYVKRSLPIIKRQILLGGIRLAGMLNKIAEKFETPANWSETSASSELSKIVLSNHPKDSVRHPQSKNEKAKPFKWREQLPYPDEH